MQALGSLAEVVYQYASCLIEEGLTRVTVKRTHGLTGSLMKYTKGLTVPGGEVGLLD